MSQDQGSGSQGNGTQGSGTQGDGAHSSSGSQEWSWLNFGVAVTKYEGPATSINIGMTFLPYLGVMKDSKQKAVTGLYTLLKEDVHTVIEAKGVGATVSAQASMQTISEAVQKGVKAGTTSMYCGTKGMKSSV